MPRARPVLVTLAAAAALAACATSDPTWRYRAEGTFGDGAAPVHVEPLAGGQVEYRVESASVADPEASVVRVVRAVGDAPVRVDLGRVRLRAGAGADVPVARVCLLDTPPRCSDGGAARGQVQAVTRGEAVRVRVDFGPLEALAPGGAPNPELARLTLVEEGVYVSGRAVPVSVPLERIPRR
ncbi:hypothetical protein [Anaeromyxobacter oryzae]|uniref:Lipoprotein n=1 Tax=Anaeromyxobacter oryzae TaxID=2918170 RepID=A0ABN6MVK7_9BACT|nr:hypothetical protein [Anaeromyxobacter oryzae]BDG03720.1 hypothetical protein AMOR_27160 [Anaeromyxobacter oryzae]